MAVSSDRATLRRRWWGSQAPPPPPCSAASGGRGGAGAAVHLPALVEQAVRALPARQPTRNASNWQCSPVGSSHAAPSTGEVPLGVGGPSRRRPCLQQQCDAPCCCRSPVAEPLTRLSCTAAWCGHAHPTRRRGPSAWQEGQQEASEPAWPLCCGALARTPLRLGLRMVGWSGWVGGGAQPQRLRPQLAAAAASREGGGASGTMVGDAHRVRLAGPLGGKLVGARLSSLRSPSGGTWLTPRRECQAGLLLRAGRAMPRCGAAAAAGVDGGCGPGERLVGGAGG